MERHTMFMNQKNHYCLDMSSLPKLIYRFNTIPIKILVGFVVEMDKQVL